MEPQIISKARVADHGEVLTGKREIEAMLDLVKQETERIDSRFLEPACGNGNFLSAILGRKLAVVEKRYGKYQLDFERYAVLAVSSIYGIDILEDNVSACRKRLYEILDCVYVRLFSEKTQDRYREAVRFILERNIIWGDALTLKTVGPKSGYIVFPEWSLLNGSMIKRRDYTFYALLRNGETRQALLFPELEKMQAKQLLLFSDLGEDVLIPTPEKVYAPVHFLEIANVEQ